MTHATITPGDSITIMRTYPDNHFDSIVTDPPYGLGFMGKAWDALPPGLEWAQECLRVLKPGGHLLAFGGTRTWHRLAVAVEDAGFEIRDSIAWLYGSGFPKSLDVSKAIDKAAGADREVVGVRTFADGTTARATAGRAGIPGSGGAGQATITAPATPEAQQWEGWGTALKPAFEPIVVGRKPLIGTVAQNVLTHGTGALNIDASRIATDEDRSRPPRTANTIYGGGAGTSLTASESNPTGRFPANVILDDTQAAALDAQGGASRFFYCAKAPKSERPIVDGVAHPTVKPLTLMRYLVRLVTPPGGTTLDPFAGSGTTLEAAILEGINAHGIERDPEYLPLIQARIDRATPPTPRPVLF